MKAIYHVLNQFSLRDAQRVLIGECWMPTADLAAIKTAITTGAQVSFPCSPIIFILFYYIIYKGGGL